MLLRTVKTQKLLRYCVSTMKTGVKTLVRMTAYQVSRLASVIHKKYRQELNLLCLSEEEDALAAFTRKHLREKRELNVCFFFTPVFTMFSWCLHSKAAALSLAKKGCMKRFRARFHRFRVNETCINKKVCDFSRKRFCVKEAFGYAALNRQLVLTFTSWQFSFPQMGVGYLRLWTSGI